VNRQTPPSLSRHPEYPGAEYRALLDGRPVPVTPAEPATPRPPRPLHHPAPSVYPTTPPWLRRNTSDDRATINPQNPDAVRESAAHDEAAPAGSGVCPHSDGCTGHVNGCMSRLNLWRRLVAKFKAL
jgi:hypothetical protein